MIKIDGNKVTLTGKDYKMVMAAAKRMKKTPRAVFLGALREGIKRGYFKSPKEAKCRS